MEQRPRQLAARPVRCGQACICAGREGRRGKWEATATRDYAEDFAVNRQLVELGYVVVSINHRSGSGYGCDSREAPGRAWRGASEYADVPGAGRWLAQREDVDPQRIGILGGSYGRLLTAHALARNSDLFAAGVAIHGVFDWSWPSPAPGH